DPVVYHWKYRLEEIDPSEEVIVDTLPVKKSS
ncbi:MAG: transposase, partial [Lachnospiraceae bacterium]|nr:transposase [Lachnospiraceae bacterium]